MKRLDTRSSMLFIVFSISPRKLLTFGVIQKAYTLWCQVNKLVLLWRVEGVQMLCILHLLTLGVIKRALYSLVSSKQTSTPMEGRGCTDVVQSVIEIILQI